MYSISLVHIFTSVRFMFLRDHPMIFTDFGPGNDPYTYKSYDYSDGQKSCTFFLEFFCGPPGGAGPIFELVDFVKWSSPTA